MSLNFKIFFVIAVVMLSAVPVRAQLFSEQGMMSGSGLMIMPTVTTVPSSELQVQYSRINFLNNSRTNLNVFGFNCGFSSYLEGYARLTSEDLQTISSQVAYAFGGKIRYPGQPPVVDRLAFWFESTVSDMNDQLQQTIYPVRANRGALTSSLDFDRGYPAFMVGASQIQSSVSLLAGIGSLHSFGHTAQMGVEFVYGYYGKNTYHTSVEGSVRIFSHLSLHLSPGYVKTSDVKSWMISAGISLSTADVDYLQLKKIEMNNDEFILPSIDDLEKQSKEEKQ